MVSSSTFANGCHVFSIKRLVIMSIDYAVIINNQVFLLDTKNIFLCSVIE
jgi:hypothetical protein